MYEILTDPRAVDVFRNIKVSRGIMLGVGEQYANLALNALFPLFQACTYRKVLEENKSKGTRKLEVAHR